MRRGQDRPRPVDRRRGRFSFPRPGFSPAPCRINGLRMAFSKACTAPALWLPHSLSRRAVERVHGIALGRWLPDLRYSHRSARGLRRADFPRSAPPSRSGSGAIPAACRASGGCAALDRRTRRSHRQSHPSPRVSRQRRAARRRVRLSRCHHRRRPMPLLPPGDCVGR